MKKYKQIVIFAGCIALFSSCASTNKARTDEPAVCKEVVSVRNEMPSLLPANKQFKLVWNDEFNGNALDESKWCYRTCFWGRRAHWFAEPKDNAVEVKDGKVYLKIVKKEDGQLVTPLLQTGHLIWDYIHDNKSSFWPISKVEKPIFLHRYGYYECRCRTQQMPGWWSAFWMQSEMQGTTSDPAYAGIEHDIMECFSPGTIIPSCFHYGGCGADHVQFTSPRTKGNVDEMSTKIAKEEFHVYGMLWEPDGYTLYLDGKPRGPKIGMEEGEAVSQVPEFLLISTEGHNFRQNNCTGTASAELEKAYEAGDAFIVDYVRVYDIAE